MTRLRAIIADLGRTGPYTPAGGHFVGYLGHALVSVWAVLIARGADVPDWAAALTVLAVAVLWKEARDFINARGVPLWRRFADWGVDASAYGFGLWTVTAGGLWVLVAVGATVAAGLTATVLWDMARPAEEAKR